MNISTRVAPEFVALLCGTLIVFSLPSSARDAPADCVGITD